ncbi:hypothetical protein LCGC14_1679160 [marine sediment metagenome]|uniref:Uncharacterized protein n=1 Tax=marine sediment metagenome TaxID=412755 RepID=A0A0F9K4Y0_9ZZZZ
MPVKLDKMQEKYEEAQKGDLWTPDEGETLLYVHPPCRDDDEHEPTDEGVAKLMGELIEEHTIG